MVSESIEYVGEYFDETFASILNDKKDARIEALKKYTKTLITMRKKRVGTGSVIVTVQTFDSLKYLESCALNIINKIGKGEIKMHEGEKEVCNVVLASFGENNVSGWTGKMSEFIEIVSNTENKKVETPGSNSFYLRNFPESLIKTKEDVDFVIFGVVIQTEEKDFYDTCAVSIIGIPENREEEIREKTILSMFGYN